MLTYITNYAEYKVITAAAADKIKAFGIQDPALILMVTKFESLIPWAQITEHSQNAVMNAVQPLVVNLYQKAGLENGQINPDTVPNYKSPTSNFLKDVNILSLIADNRKGREGKINTNAGAEIIEATSRILADNETVPKNPQGMVEWKDENSEAILTAVKQSKKLEIGINYLLNYYNSIKESVFTEWIEAVADMSPAKKFVILKPVFDSSSATNRGMPTPFNKNAFAQLSAAIDAVVDLQQANDFNTTSIYKQASEIQIDVQKQEGMNNWLRIKSLQNDAPDQFQKNVQQLYDIARNSSTSWCIGGSRGTAESYLKQGDFWMYMKGGKATVCIRQSGKTILEIRDPTQMQFCMAEAGDIVWLVEDSPFSKFFDPKSEAYRGNANPHLVGGNVGANIERDHNYAKIGDINRAVKTEQGTADFQAKLATDPFYYNWLLPENKEPFKAAALQGFSQILKTQPQRYAEVPPDFANMPQMGEAIIEGLPQLLSTSRNYADIINDLPTKFKFLKTNQNFWASVAAGLTTRFAVAPPTDDEFNKIDVIVNKYPKVLYNLAEGVTKAIARTPSTFFKLPQAWLAKPQFFDVALKAFTQVAPKYLQENPEKDIFAKLPEQMQNDQNIRQAVVNGVPTFLKRKQEPLAIPLVPDFALQDPTVIQFIKAWLPPFMAANIRNIKYVPEALKNDPEWAATIVGPVTQGAINHIIANPEDIEIMWQYVPDKAAMLNAYCEGAKAKMMTDAYFQIPDEIMQQLSDQQRQELSGVKFTKNIEEIVKFPRLLLQYPDLIRNRQAIDRIAQELAAKIQNGKMQYDAKLHTVLLQHPAIKEAKIKKDQAAGKVIKGPAAKPRPQLPAAPAAPQLPPPAPIPNMPEQMNQQQLPNPQQLPPPVQASWYGKIKTALSKCPECGSPNVASSKPDKVAPNLTYLNCKDCGFNWPIKKPDANYEEWLKRWNSK